MVLFLSAEDYQTLSSAYEAWEQYIQNIISVEQKVFCIGSRFARGYSLDTVAGQTGVSKSMLGQIERGEANPAIGILGKIVSVFYYPA